MVVICFPIHHRTLTPAAATPMMNIELINSFARLQEIREPWNSLAGDHPFRRFEWLVAWAEAYVEEQQLYVVAAWHGDWLVGLLPLYRHTSPTQAHALRWLGSGEVCTDHLGLMLAVEEQYIIDRLAAFLQDTCTAPNFSWDSLELEAVPDSDLITRTFVETLEQAHCQLHRAQGMNYWKVGLPDSWDGYLTSFSKSHRKKTRRVQRKLEQGEGIRIRYATDPATLREGMEVLVSLHQMRRESLTEPGCFASPRFSRFLHAAASGMLECGQLQLAWAELDGIAIAAEFQLVNHDATFAYQSGIHPDYLEHEPGRLIMIATIQRAIAREQAVFDFLRGDEAYKPHWRAECHTTSNYRLVAPKVTSRMRHGVWLAGVSLKGWMRSAIRKHPTAH